MTQTGANAKHSQSLNCSSTATIVMARHRGHMMRGANTPSTCLIRISKTSRSRYQPRPTQDGGGEARGAVEAPRVGSAQMLPEPRIGLDGCAMRESGCCLTPKFSCKGFK